MFDENDIKWDVLEMLGDVVITARYGAIMSRHVMSGRDASIDLGMELKRRMTEEIRLRSTEPQYKGPTFQPYHPQTVGRDENGRFIPAGAGGVACSTGGGPYHTLQFHEQYQAIPQAYGPPIYQKTSDELDEMFHEAWIKGNRKSSWEYKGNGIYEVSNGQKPVSPEMEAYNEYDQSDD